MWYPFKKKRGESQRARGWPLNKEGCPGKASGLTWGRIKWVIFFSTVGVVCIGLTVSAIL